ncbi:unnamed protein product [Blepharisma stoltei]|uniref:Uncharacterized protein n=1 Tax=Blepharisma stoltei TaxID=1481888 RepID=A0AAU9IDZ2_9CILI|nr:unnamed protein product [Blepharisma stoltei]
MSKTTVEANNSVIDLSQPKKHFRLSDEKCMNSYTTISCQPIDENCESRKLNNLYKSHYAELMIMKPQEAAKLFKKITDDKIISYKELYKRVNSLLKNFDNSLDAVSVRDDCSIQPSTIKINKPALSLLFRRRTSGGNTVIN